MIDPQAKTILVADDDTHLVEMLTTRCGHLGLNVLTANDSLTALSTIDFVLPDLVCLDVNMPGGSGLSVGEMIVSDKRLSAVPVIIMTAQTDSNTIHRCHQMRAEYVPKRGDFWNQLRPVICRLLDINDPQTAG